jgi:hypothetical protein
MIVCVMIVIDCKGYKCNFTQVAPCAYKYMNSTPILFTLICTRLFITLVLIPSVKPKVQMYLVLFLFVHHYIIRNIL